MNNVAFSAWVTSGLIGKISPHPPTLLEACPTVENIASLCRDNLAGREVGFEINTVDYVK